MKTVRILIIGWALCLVQMLAAQSYQQDTIPETVVTATGTLHLLKNVPVQTEVITSKMLQNYAGRSLEDILSGLTSSFSFNEDDMGSHMQLGGLGNSYILILIDGKRIHGDVGGENDLSLIDPQNIEKIEIVKGASSALYGSDAIAGVINIITDQPTQNLVSVTSDTRVSGHGVLTEAVNLDIYKNGLGSYTSFVHDRADSYRTNDMEYVKGSDTDTQPTIAPLFTGYRSNLFSQKLTYAPHRQWALNAGIDYSYKITDRPETRSDITGGTDYEMRYKGLRWNLGGIYKFSGRNSLQADFTVDRFRYGKEYDVATKDFAVGDYVQSKKQRTMEGNLKAILDLPALWGDNRGNSTTIVGADWRRDNLTATSGNIDQHVTTLAAYAQHEQRFPVGRGTVSATLGLRYTHHEAFNNHFTPKATLMYSIGPVNLRATYSAGFRAPGLDELYYHYYSVNRGKPQSSFGNQNLKPEKSHYWAMNIEYRTQQLAVSLTGYLNRISDMMVKQNIDIDNTSLTMLRSEFPEMTDAEASKLVSYAL